MEDGLAEVGGVLEVGRYYGLQLLHHTPAALYCRDELVNYSEWSGSAHYV
jgi:hypothetical protein